MYFNNIMKKSMKMAALLVAGVALFAACKGDGFKTTENNLYYKFEKENPGAQQVQEGDVLVGELTVKLDTVMLFSTQGQARRIAQAFPNTFVHVGEGLLMMHLGDVATFAIDADTMAKYLNPNQMPPMYQPGKGMKFYYEVSLQDIVTKDEIMQEQANFEANMEERRNNEASDLAEYIQNNNITAKPTADGLYVIVKKKGNGAKVEAGKTLSVNYTGRLLDGTVFDSSVESDAREGNIFNPQRKYEPISFQIGADQMIRGWERGLMGLTAGTTAQLIIPSNMAYGSRGSGEKILPYTPLVFDIEILEVK